MDANQTAFEIAKRGGRVEAQDGDKLLVSSGTPNHALHFIMGFFTFGLWWVLVWLPMLVAGGKRQRVVYANTSDTDLRLPHELPAPVLTTIACIVVAVVVWAISGNAVLGFLSIIALAVAIRSLANR